MARSDCLRSSQRVSGLPKQSSGESARNADLRSVGGRDPPVGGVLRSSRYARRPNPGGGRGFGLRRVRVVLAGLGHVVIHADVVDGSGGDRAGTPGPGGKISPLGAVASLGGVHHAALHGGVHRSCCLSAAGELLVILCRTSDA